MMQMAECDSCAYVAALIQDPSTLGSLPTDPTASSEPAACSLNAGTGAISDTEASFALTSSPNPTQADGAVALVADYDALYVGGFTTVTPGDTAWRIEKRDRVTGALVAAFGTGGAITSNPGGNGDSINAMAIDASGIYAAGLDRTLGAANGQWRVEKRDRATGALVAAFGTGGVLLQNITGANDFLNSVIVAGGALYLVGSASAGVPNQAWRIEKRDPTTGALIAAFNSTGFVDVAVGGGGTSQARSVALDANFMYIAGTSNAGNPQWRIEKHNLLDASLVTAFDTDGIVETNVSPGIDQAFRIAVDGSSIYVAGSDPGGGGQMRLEKRNKTTGALETGFNTTGVLTVNTSGADDFAHSLFLSDSHVYLGGSDRVAGNAQMHIGKYDATSGAPVNAFDLDGVLQINPGAANDQINDLCVDAAFVYAVGDTGTGTAQDWYILKRNKTTGL